MPTILTHLPQPVTGGAEPDPKHDRAPGTPAPTRPHPGHTARTRHLTRPYAARAEHPSQEDEALRRAREADERRQTGSTR